MIQFVVCQCHWQCQDLAQVREKSPSLLELHIFPLSICLMVSITFDNIHEPFFHLQEQKANQKYFIHLFVKDFSYILS